MFFSGKIVAYQELFNIVMLLPISTQPQKRQKRENKQNKSSELAAKFFAFIEISGPGYSSRIVNGFFNGFVFHIHS